MFCTRCGNKVASNNIACPHCGYIENDETEKKDNVVDVEVKEAKPMPTKEKKQPNSKPNNSSNNFKYLKIYFIYLLMLLPIALMIPIYMIYKFNIYFFVSLGTVVILEFFAGYLYIHNK